MLKRIPVDRLVVGMYVKEFCGSWMDHPFWRSSFVVTDVKEIDTIRRSSVREVWIDVSRGIDIAEDRGADPVRPATTTDTDDPGPAAPATREPCDTGRVPVAAEFARAARIVASSRQAVASMFEEARMGRAIDAQGARELVEQIADSVSRNPGALISLARLKTADDYTYMHSVAVCALMIALARQLGFAEQQARVAGTAGLLHDLGKAVMPLEILNKPGKLTDDEFAIIRSHPEEGYRMLREGGVADQVALDVVLHHHEKVDGSGYPRRLKGDEISLVARMGAVCDVYDAITSNRPYKAGWDPAESLRRMAEWSTGHFDSNVFQAFVKSIGIYPIGSLVLLSCGRLGVVVEQGDKSLLSPRVKVFFSTRSSARILPAVVDLEQPGCRFRIVSREDPGKWKFPDLNEIWSGLPNLQS